MSENKHQFVVMAKPVGSICNMHCSYCYYLEKGKYSTHQKQKCIGQSLLEQLIKETIASNKGPIVSFVWHGGEPTLAGLDFYKKAVEYQKRYLPKGWQAWNNIQSNGLLIDEKWAKFLKDNNFDVGISIDGSQQVHDSNRLDLGNKPTYNKALRAIKKLQSVGLQPDLLCTVNSETVKHPLEVYEALRDLRTGWMQFIPIVVREKDGVSKESVNPVDYGNFLCEVFDKWASNDLGKCDVQLFAEMARIMAGQSASLCWMSEICGNVIIVEEDGRVYSCDHFVDNDHRLGVLGKTSLLDLLNSEDQQKFGNFKKDGLTEQCKKCPWLKYCNGACPKDRFGKSDDGQDGQYYLCDGLRMFFKHAEPILKLMINDSKARKNNQQIMAEVKEYLESKKVFD